MSVKKTAIHNFGLDSGYREIDSSSIDFPVRRNILFQKQIINVPVDNFSIDGIQTSDYLIVDSSSLLKLKFIGGVGKEGVSIENFKLTSYNNPYQVLLNHDAILDCNDLDKESAEIKFKVKFSFENQVISEDYIVVVRLVKAKPDCTINFLSKNDLKYKHDNVCVGHFEIENSCAYRYAELAALNLSIKYPTQFSENLVFPYCASEVLDERTLSKTIHILKYPD